jgi:hypothetical protein
MKSPTPNREQKCQCQQTGTLLPHMASWYSAEDLPYVNHKPNECKCKNDLKQYWKDGKKVWLCSCCVMGETEV